MGTARPLASLCVPIAFVAARLWQTEEEMLGKRRVPLHPGRQIGFAPQPVNQRPKRAVRLHDGGFGLFHLRTGFRQMRAGYPAIILVECGQQFFLQSVSMARVALNIICGIRVTPDLGRARHHMFNPRAVSDPEHLMCEGCAEA